MAESQQNSRPDSLPRESMLGVKGKACQGANQQIPERQATRNTSLAIHFIIRGAEKRRHLAYDKAKHLQRELGVIPRLICIK